MSPRQPSLTPIPDPVSPCEAVQVGLLVLNLGWTTLGLGGYRPETMVVTGLLTGLLLAIHLLAPVFARHGAPDDPGSARFHPAGWFTLPFLGYAALSAGVLSPAPWLGWRDWLAWTQLAVIFWVGLNGVRSVRGQAALFYTLVGLAVTAVVLAAYQRFVQPSWLMLGREQVPQFIGRSSGSFGIPNSLAGLLILLLPPVGALAGRRGSTPVQKVLLTYLTLVLVLGLGLTISRGAWLALAAVLLVWPLAAFRRSWLRRTAAAAIALVAIVLTVGIFSSASPRVQARLAALRADRGERSRPTIWRTGWAVFGEHKMWGAGAGMFALAFEKHRPPTFQDEPVWAHNEYLNLLCDYGLAGGVLALGGAGAVVVGGLRARRRASAGKADGAASPFGAWWPVPHGALAAGCAAFALHSVVEFHLKIPALAMALAVVAALWVRSVWPPPAEQTPSTARSVALVTAAAVVAIGLLSMVYPTYRAEARRRAAREDLDHLAIARVPATAWAPVLDGARIRLRQTVELDPRNAAAWADLAHAIELTTLAEASRAQDLGREAETAARRAVLLSGAVPEFWIRLGVAFDVQGRWTEAGSAFAEALELAPARSDVWYYHASHLALKPFTRERAAAAAEFCLRLDPGNQAAQALRQRVADRTRAH